MSDEVNPVSAEEREPSSDLLLSVEPLREDAKLYEAKTKEETTDPSDDAADADDLDSDATDDADEDGPPADEEEETWPDHRPLDSDGIDAI